MKIAVVSDDGTHLSQHFGRAPLYVVFEVEDGKIVGREVRKKGYHHGLHVEPQGLGQHQHQHQGEADGHRSMTSPIADCSVILAGGMGAGAYNSLVAMGVEPAFVAAGDVESAVADYLAGRTIDHPLCRH